ncbi:MAG: LPS assembly lipoprotein LptE [Planctomycetaceae bacterium]|nr:LPS assembly lipoprotein LptE [Planctomycetaceae bacterium]
MPTQRHNELDINRRRAAEIALCTVLWGIVTLGFLGCSGYQIGTKTLYNTEIKTVHVPIFQSDSFRRDMGERLTEAVCKKIEQRTPYKVVHRSRSADSVLAGRLGRESQNVSLVDDYAGTRQKKVELTVYVQWKDRRGNSLRTMSPIIWHDAPVDITTGSDMVAELGHSYATASQAAIERMADQIVDMMQMPW